MQYVFKLHYLFAASLPCSFSPDCYVAILLRLFSITEPSWILCRLCSSKSSARMQSFRRINQLVRRQSPDAHFKSIRGYPLNGDAGCSCSSPMSMENTFTIPRLSGNPYGFLNGSLLRSFSKLGNQYPEALVCISVYFLLFRALWSFIGMLCSCVVF